MRPGDDEPEIHFVETGRPHSELVSHRPSRLDRFGGRWLLVAAVVVALAIGAGAGYASGNQNGKNVVVVAPTPTPSATTTEPPGLPDSVVPTGVRCSVQTGTTLQVGVEIANGTRDRITLDRLEVDLPMGGMRIIRTARGACGQLPSETGDDITGNDLAAGKTMWVTVRVRVLVDCPQPLPVVMTLDYTRDGRHVSTALGGFPDLGDVPYSGC